MTLNNKIQEARNLIRESLKKYPNVVVGCSFGKDSMVTLHLVRSVRKVVPVFGIMADTEFASTYKFADRVARKWKLNYRELRFTQDAVKCCGSPKVEKTKEALADYPAWISGVRRTEGIGRSHFEKVEEQGGLVKINPILDFTELDVWRYLALYKVPVNPMYKKGFRSLGCKLCSAPEEDENEPERAGRWRGTEHWGGECGIHSQRLR